jgi:hypothetical protein
MPEEIPASSPEKAAPEQALPEQALPGKGFFGWLGRQFGYVSRAVAHDPGGPRTVYRVSSVEEKPLPEDQSVRLRRTTIDEVIVERNSKSETRNSNQ